MSVDVTQYNAPATSHAPGRELEVAAHECLRIGVTVGTVWVFPWSEQPGTNFALIEHPDRQLEGAHLAPTTVDALLEIAPIVEAVPLLRSPSWPILNCTGTM